MRRLHRLITLLTCALLIAAGVALVALAIRPSDWSAAWALVSASRWRAGAVPGLLLAALGLWLLLGDAPRKARSRFLSFRNDGGAVNISTTAISEYIEKLLPAFPSVVRMDCDVAPHRRKVDIIVDVRIKAGPQLHEICETLQQQVRERMENGLGIRDVRHVVIRVREISSEHKTA